MYKLDLTAIFTLVCTADYRAYCNTTLSEYRVLRLYVNRMHTTAAMH